METHIILKNEKSFLLADTDWWSAIVVPDSNRGVQVLLENGTVHTGYFCMLGWKIYPDGKSGTKFIPETFSPKFPVIGWRELQKPKIPEGWHSVTELPSKATPNSSASENVQIILKDGTKGYGWRWFSGDEPFWRFTKEFSKELYNPGFASFSTDKYRHEDILCWKELPQLLKIGDEVWVRGVIADIYFSGYAIDLKGKVGVCTDKPIIIGDFIKKI